MTRRTYGWLGDEEAYCVFPPSLRRDESARQFVLRGVRGRIRLVHKICNVIFQEPERWAYSTEMDGFGRREMRSKPEVRCSCKMAESNMGPARLCADICGYVRILEKKAVGRSVFHIVHMGTHVLHESYKSWTHSLPLARPSCQGAIGYWQGGGGNLVSGSLLKLR
jgi:hypothetical protein